MQRSSINPAIADAFLRSAKNAADKGHAQFPTPIEFARLVATQLPQWRESVVDLNCANGQLLYGCANATTENILGCDIDPGRFMNDPTPATLDLLSSPDKAHRIQRTRITADLAALYPMLKDINWAADLFVLNPPWGLQWYARRFEYLEESTLPAVAAAYKKLRAVNADVIDSTVTTLMVALDLCSRVGEGVLIANHATMHRLIFAPDAPAAALANHVWLHVILNGNPMTGLDDCKWEKETQFKTSLLYFSPGHSYGCHTVGCDSAPGLSDLRTRHRLGAERLRHNHTSRTVPGFQTVAREIADMEQDARQNRPRYQIWLDGNTIQTHLSEYESIDRKVDKAELTRLFQLNGRSPMELAIQRSSRDEMVHVARKAGWRVDPRLIEAIEHSIREYHQSRAPLYSLPTIQRLGYLDEQDYIVCRKNLYLTAGKGKGLPVFQAGQTYPLSTKSVTVTRDGERINPFTGLTEAIEFSGQQLAIIISGGEPPPGADDQTRHASYGFMTHEVLSGGFTVPSPKPEDEDGTGKPVDFDLQQLVDHFEIPDVPDVASANPAAHQIAVARLREIETLCGVNFHPFQIDDLSRGSLHNGLIFAWDTGLWKTGASYVWPLLKVGFTTSDLPADPVLPQPLIKVSGRRTIPLGSILQIVPGDLHEQTAREAAEKFHIEVYPIKCQADFLRLVTGYTSDARPIIPPGFYITSYTQLCQNNVARLPDPAKDNLDAFTQKFQLTPEELKRYYDRRGEIFACHFHRLRLRSQDHCWSDLELAHKSETARTMRVISTKERESQLGEIDAAYGTLANLIPRNNLPPRFDLLDPEQVQSLQRNRIVSMLNGGSVNVGETWSIPIGPPPSGFKSDRPETDTREIYKVNCVYSPSLAELSCRAFDVVTADEGVRIKSEDAIIALGGRLMDPKYRLLLTATPIKNRLPDFFRLAWWVTGAQTKAHARWPYRDHPDERQRFAETFLVAEKAAKGRRRVVLTAEVCNIHLFWKLAAPIVLRKRKSDAGIPIVKKVRHVVRCELGTQQALVYKYHLAAAYKDVNGNHAVTAQLQALRTAAADPTSDGLLSKPGGATDQCPECAKAVRKKCGTCGGSGIIDLPARSTHSYTPKIATTLKLIEDILGRGEQVVVFSAFHTPNDVLGLYLNQAGVPFHSMDGRTSPLKRGVASAEFKLGPPSFRGVHIKPDARVSTKPVTLAGVDSMAEGHSWNLANNVILICYSWAADKFKQALDRVHRLNSVVDVNVYVVLVQGTIERRLESLTDEKTDSSDLCLDGRLMGERREEVNLFELLNLAREEFGSNNNTIDEVRLKESWPELQERLRKAAHQWQNMGQAPARPNPVATPVGQASSLSGARLDLSLFKFTTTTNSQTPDTITMNTNQNPNRMTDDRTSSRTFHHTTTVVIRRQPPVQVDWKIRMQKRAEALRRLE